MDDELKKSEKNEVSETTDAAGNKAESVKSTAGSDNAESSGTSSGSSAIDAKQTQANDALADYIKAMETPKQSYQKSADEVIKAPDIETDSDFTKSGPVEMNFKQEGSETTDTPSGKASSVNEPAPKGSTKMEKRKARVGASTSGNMSRLRIAAYKAKFIDWLLPMFNSILNNDDDIKKFKAEPEDFEDIVEAIYDESAEREEELKEEWGLKYILATIYLPGTVSGLYYRGNAWYKKWKENRKKPRKPNKQARTAVSSTSGKPEEQESRKTRNAPSTNVCKHPDCNTESGHAAFCGSKHRKAYEYRVKAYGWPDHTVFTATLDENGKKVYSPPQSFPKPKK